MSDVDQKSFLTHPSQIHLRNQIDSDGWHEMAGTRYVRRLRERAMTKRVKPAKVRGNGFG